MASIDVDLDCDVLLNFQWSVIASYQVSILSYLSFWFNNTDIYIPIRDWTGLSDIYVEYSVYICLQSNQYLPLASETLQTSGSSSHTLFSRPSWFCGEKWSWSVSGSVTLSAMSELPSLMLITLLERLWVAGQRQEDFLFVVIVMCCGCCDLYPTYILQVSLVYPHNYLPQVQDPECCGAR